MRTPFILCLLMSLMMSALGQSQPGFAVNFVVPTDSTNQDANSFSYFPFIEQSTRYQQVYAASEFSYLTNFGGGWLFGILFRGDPFHSGFRVQIPSIQVNLSTTQRGPDQLSPVFSENVGVDDKAVFAGYLDAFAVGGGGQGPESFNFQIYFSNFFLFNPSAGNLLMDIRIFQGKTNMSFDPALDAWNRTNDSISRVWWGNVNASTGVVDTAGLVTQFYFWPNPKLTVQQNTNSVLLWWPLNPTSFVFQSSQSLFPQPQWQPITNGIVRSNFINTFTVPSSAMVPSAYFRLISAPP